MMEKTKMTGSLWLMLVVMFSLPFFILPIDANAKAKVVAVEGVRYDVTSGLKDNLKSLVGKKVYVHLDSGNTMAGTIKEVGKKLVHLEKLDGKTFFDGLILIENISAIEVRFREYPR